MAEKTIFEKIVSGELPSKKVLENEKFLAFYDIAPKAPVHILAIPKVCIKDFDCADSKLLGELCGFAQEVVKKVGLDKSGYRIITNIGIDGGQEVPHLHLHILGGAKLKFPPLV
ncbi:histidine triad nucleotide-binding protein [Helicobacter cinaedi PAGU611]|uniref:Histidine triad domain protein n=1 Tax=Helicobacter cinaedi CCUG 18818 = ATCC BAA-847 TaxID=537971 RepID=A0ABN0BBH3_9HELI|nr:histidine triad nucleotide-binding protein [Helicobacter cinaedi]EFR46950.1 histidine triad domain protein [Helicobacter cinaedi CCUG 18818 = ATCC BAA-847]QOQ91544.1 histidine triad nucleotide-binding protein [Helicobacter cinaedi]BAM12065.1 histidine triad nucleotide-binding protein [Helicobacter cinaedi PAGU611]BBB19690.1 HIT family protein [Helicobacter cinaedi]